MSYIIRDFEDEKSWKNWRSKHIGASEIGAVLGVSPYLTRSDILYKKQNPESKEKEAGEYIAQKGHDLERILRTKIEIAYNLELPPICMDCKEYSFLACSLDGFDKQKEVLWECKKVGKEIYDKGEIPEKYKPQVQMQLLISGATLGLFTMATDESNYKTLKITHDTIIQNKIIEEGSKFFDEWQKGVKPPEGFKEKMEELFKKDVELKKLTDEVKKLKEYFKKEDFKNHFSHEGLIYKRVERVTSRWDSKRLTEMLERGQIPEIKTESLSVSYSVKKEKV